MAVIFEGTAGTVNPLPEIREVTSVYPERGNV